MSHAPRAPAESSWADAVGSHPRQLGVGEIEHLGTSCLVSSFSLAARAAVTSALRRLWAISARNHDLECTSDLRGSQRLFKEACSPLFVSHLRLSSRALPPIPPNPMPALFDAIVIGTGQAGPALAARLE